jgi:isoleucine--tRNA ligase
VKNVKVGHEFRLDKHLTTELLEEGFIRELIRFVQAARKKVGLEVDDRIKLSIDTEIDDKWQEILKTEVLATTLSFNDNYEYDEVIKINGKNITISLEKM